MALSPPVPRKHLHTREIRCFGYEREDGLWDIEGSITDLKTYPFANLDRGTVSPGQPVHHMVVRLTMDKRLVVRDAEAEILASPYNMCPEIAAGVAGLKGLRIAAGWTRDVKRVIGRTRGCTHITQLLLGPVAVAAYQTIVPKLQRERRQRGEKDTPSNILDTCYAFATDSPVVKREWPEAAQGE